MFHDPKSPMAQAFAAIPTDFKELETMYVERVKRFFDGEQIPVADSGSRAQEARLSHQVADAGVVGRIGQADSSYICQGVHQPNPGCEGAEHHRSGPHAAVRAKRSVLRGGEWFSEELGILRGAAQARPAQYATAGGAAHRAGPPAVCGESRRGSRSGVARGVPRLGGAGGIAARPTPLPAGVAFLAPLV